MNYISMTVQDLLTLIKNSERLFFGLGIDTSTRLDEKLFDVLKEKEIPASPVLHTLELLQKQPETDVYWLLNSASVLIDYIERYYHQRHRFQLPELIRLSMAIEEKDVQKTLFPDGLTKILTELEIELLEHMEKEERLIFPMLVADKSDYIYFQVSGILHNHDHHSYVLQKIKGMTNHFTPPDGASALWVDFYKKLVEFRKELLEHIRLENEILFN